jgi:two-component system alkaline phosphatase synthesis response regulator PhoP
VEDEKSISELIQLNLELEGYDVTIFEHGLKAKNSLTDPAIYDLIILDVMLPGVSGIDLCKHIRSLSNVPVMFLSAKGTTGDRIEGLKAGGNDYLPKPFDLEELLLRVGVLAFQKRKSESFDFSCAKKERLYHETKSLMKCGVLTSILPQEPLIILF